MPVFKRTGLIANAKVTLVKTRSLFRRTEPPKLVTAPEAVSHVKSNDRIYMHGCAAFPLTLAEALAQRHNDLTGVEVNHLHVEYENPLSRVAAAANNNGSEKPFHVANYFIGAKERKYVAEGVSDLIPCFLSDLPGLMRLGYRKPRISMIQVSPPDRHGFCSLGIEVCTAYAACETSDIIIAQINKHVPRTSGQSFIHYNCLDYVVETNKPLPSAPVSTNDKSSSDSVEELIGKNVANLVTDGSCLQVGIGAIPNAVLACLGNHKNLGLHTGKRD